jgi:hypothetical protein
LQTYALVSLWSEPDEELLRDSLGTLYACVYHGMRNLRVIKVEAIVSVVAVIPLKPSEVDTCSRHFVVEKPGLDALIMGQDDDDIVAAL